MSKPRRITLFGVKFVMPKGARRKINADNPELKGKNLNETHWPKKVMPKVQKRN